MEARAKPDKKMKNQEGLKNSGLAGKIHNSGRENTHIKSAYHGDDQGDQGKMVQDEAVKIPDRFFHVHHHRYPKIVISRNNAVEYPDNS